MYARPCFRRMPKAFPARTNTINRESGAKSRASSDVEASLFKQDASSRSSLSECSIDWTADRRPTAESRSRASRRSSAPAIRWTSGPATLEPASQTRWDTGNGTGRRAGPTIRRAGSEGRQPAIAATLPRNSGDRDAGVARQRRVDSRIGSRSGGRARRGLGPAGRPIPRLPCPASSATRARIVVGRVSESQRIAGGDNKHVALAIVILPVGRGGHCYRCRHL